MSLASYRTAPPRAGLKTQRVLRAVGVSPGDAEVKARRKRRGR